MHPLNVPLQPERGVGGELALLALVGGRLLVILEGGTQRQNQNPMFTNLNRIAQWSKVHKNHDRKQDTLRMWACSFDSCQNALPHVSQIFSGTADLSCTLFMCLSTEL